MAWEPLAAGCAGLYVKHEGRAPPEGGSAFSRSLRNLAF
jgi:hypothetical protein